MRWAPGAGIGTRVLARTPRAGRQDSVGGVAAALGSFEAWAQAELAQQQQRAESREVEARREAAKSGQLVQLMEPLLASSNPQEGKDKDYKVRHLLEDFARELPGRLGDAPEVELSLRRVMGMSCRTRPSRSCTAVTADRPSERRISTAVCNAALLLGPGWATPRGGPGAAQTARVAEPCAALGGKLAERRRASRSRRTTHPLAGGTVRGGGALAAGAGDDVRGGCNGGAAARRLAGVAWRRYAAATTRAGSGSGVAPTPPTEEFEALGRVQVGDRIQGRALELEAEAGPRLDSTPALVSSSSNPAPVRTQAGPADPARATGCPCAARPSPPAHLRDGAGGREADGEPMQAVAEPGAEVDELAVTVAVLLRERERTELAVLAMPLPQRPAAGGGEEDALSAA